MFKLLQSEQEITAKNSGRSPTSLRTSKESEMKKPYSVYWSRSAEFDLESIVLYIAHGSDERRQSIGFH